MRIAGEGVHVGAFQVDHPTTVLVEEGVLRRVVEVVGVILLVGVGDDLARPNPRPLGSVRLAVPHLAEHRRPEGLRGDHDVSLAKVVPESRAVVQQD
jgi:hypothetical protein